MDNEIIVSNRKKQLQDSADKLKKSVEEADRIDDYYARGRSRKFNESKGAGITQRSMKKFSSEINKNENAPGLNKMPDHRYSDKRIPTKYWLIVLFIIAAVFFVISLSFDALFLPA